jgi:hypothetical protein
VRAMGFTETRERLRAAITSTQPRSLVAGALSVLLHVAGVCILIDMDVRSGDPSTLPVLFVEDFSPQAPLRTAYQPPAEDPLVDIVSEPELPEIEPQEPTLDPLLDTELADASIAPPENEFVTLEPASSSDAPAAKDAEDVPPPPQPEPPAETPGIRMVEIPADQQSQLIDRMQEAAQALLTTDRAEISWEEDGRQYRAVLKRQAVSNNMDFERIAAEVTTTDQGSSMRTELWLSRLAFSKFAHVIDRWDPDVQMHDDEIVGRFHSNSAFFVTKSAGTMPTFKGQVTTAARSPRFSGASRRHLANIFQGGIETSAQRIDFPQRSQPFELAPPERDAQIQRFEDEAHITLAGDGSYTWQSRQSDVALRETYSPARPLYLLANPKKTLYVSGVVSGRVLVYSPRRIVIEGSLTYANDPRLDPDSGDLLGIVSDGDVEIARPYVTGRGDLRIDAAIFARRRFVVTDFAHFRQATLRIYGSLSAGSISASEPRYATKMVFDPRLDRIRPPGFPSTNRFELERWTRTWQEETPVLADEDE